MLDDWSVEFYHDEAGHSPVREFIEGLDMKTKARFEWSIEQLRLRNVRAKEPLVRHLEGDLWELREESRTNIYRMIYFFFTGRRIVLLHGFQKKTPKMPARELEVARRRHAAFMGPEAAGR